MAAKKTQQTQAQRIEAVVATIGQQLGPEYEAALNQYAAAKGKRWAQQLTEDWYAGRDASFRDVGHLLRQVRNHPDHGPAFYRALNG